MQNVLVKESKIQGKGVFAAKRFHKGEEILEINDSHIVEDEATLTEEDWEYNADFFDSQIVIMQEPERCINHSCDANSYVKTINTVRKLIAIKDIAEGDEITYDCTINGDNEGTFLCNCGSKRCRKIFNGNFFKLPIELQIEYLPYLEDWFIRKYKDKIDTLKNQAKHFTHN
jgi:SET domain-containing protein